MKITDRCPSCGSYSLEQQIGEIAPFITSYVFGRDLVMTDRGPAYKRPLRFGSSRIARTKAGAGMPDATSRQVFPKSSVR